MGVISVFSMFSRVLHYLTAADL